MVLAVALHNDATDGACARRATNNHIGPLPRRSAEELSDVSSLGFSFFRVKERTISLLQDAFSIVGLVCRFLFLFS